MDRLLPCLIVGIFAGLSVPTIQPNAWAGSLGQPGPLGLLRAAASPCSGTPPLRTPPSPPPILHHLLPPESKTFLPDFAGSAGVDAAQGLGSLP